MHDTAVCETLSMAGPPQMKRKKKLAWSTASDAGWGRRLNFVAALAVAVAAVACRGRGPDPVVTELIETRRLVGDLRVGFNKAVEASNRAVMADTDEASRSFAREAEQATQLVQDGIKVAGSHLSSLGYPDETRFLDEFAKHFADYRALDQTILGLAVENTNLKAQALLFGPAKKAAEDFQAALDETIALGTTPKNRCPAETLAATAVSHLREVQILEAPHIAEADDAAMTGMEKEMTTLQGSVDGSLQTLEKMTSPAGRASIAKALAALARFKDVARQIVTLSRRNSNVRSLALSLRDAPPLAAACDASLGALQDALAKEGTTATR
jgi:hypothetical protein